MIDRERLNEQVRASGYKKKYLAQALGISAASLTNKLNGRTEFKLSEAQTLGWLLGMTEAEQKRCFWFLR